MDKFKNKRFDVEHALVMHAHSYAVLPAAALYEKDLLETIERVAQRCHIYLVGHTPTISLREVIEGDQMTTLRFEVEEASVDLQAAIPPGSSLVCDGEWFRVFDAEGQEYGLDYLDIARQIKMHCACQFHVLYIGQAYGKAGERAALDRLLKHETLQKIALQGGAPKGRQLYILMLEVMPTTQVITYFNPHAADRSQGEARIQAGLDKLHGTSEKERVTLYEASLIRYFQPRYNKEFKDSFPSTDMKVLKDCYDKDFSGVVAEINFDDLPWDLTSNVVPAAAFHIAKHPLHTEEERSMFFAP